VAQNFLLVLAAISVIPDKLVVLATFDRLLPHKRHDLSSIEGGTKQGVSCGQKAEQGRISFRLT
jgi:hypothetical protein